MLLVLLLLLDHDDWHATQILKTIFPRCRDGEEEGEGEGEGDLQSALHLVQNPPTRKTEEIGDTEENYKANPLTNGPFQLLDERARVNGDWRRRRTTPEKQREAKLMPSLARNAQRMERDGVHHIQWQTLTP